MTIVKTLDPWFKRFVWLLCEEQIVGGAEREWANTWGGRFSIQQGGGQVRDTGRENAWDLSQGNGDEKKWMDLDDILE